MASRSTSTSLPPSFFVFGPERSGTTLLTFLLSGQPGMFCMNDSFIFKCFVDSVMWATPGLGNASVSNLLRTLPELLPELVEGGPPKGWSLRESVYRAHTRILCRDYSANYLLSAGERDCPEAC